MKTLTIIRGLPGSGKSTFAREISDRYWEADMFFLSITGEYRYDPTKLAEAHKWCQDGVEASMNEGYAHIAVSNIFQKRWQIEPYLKLAEKYGYMVFEITLTGKNYGNLHGVPEEKLKQIKEGWEP